MRSPDSARVKTKHLARNEVNNSTRTVKAWLAEPWDGIAQTVMVKLDRGQSSVGTKARISLLGAIYTSVATGTPVSLRVTRGVAEVISIDSTFLSGVLATIMKGCELTRTTGQAISASTDTPINFNVITRNDFGTNLVTSVTALASGGTVTKTSGSATIAGSSTKFLDDLSIGDVIQIPGTATEYFVVTDIASNTSLTVQANAANTASGQTCSTSNVGVVIPSNGWYAIGGEVEWAGDATGSRTCQIMVNGIGVSKARQYPPNTSVQFQIVGKPKYLLKYDLVQLNVTQTTASSLTTNQTAAAPTLSVVTAVA